jgi:hypothetical protein
VDVEVDEAGKQHIATQNGCHLRHRKSSGVVDRNDPFALDKHDRVLDDSAGGGAATRMAMIVTPDSLHGCPRPGGLVEGGQAAVVARRLSR